MEKDQYFYLAAIFNSFMLQFDHNNFSFKKKNAQNNPQQQQRIYKDKPKEQ